MPVFYITPEKCKNFILHALSSNYLSRIEFAFPVPQDVPLLKVVQDTLPTDFLKCQGEFSQQGVTCSFFYDGAVFHVIIVRKPFYVPETQIENGLQENLEKSVRGPK